MSEDGILNLNEISWSFKEVCTFAKHIKPENWCIVLSSDRIAFIEIKLPYVGPANLQKQLILSNYLHIEVYVGNNKLSDKVLRTDFIHSFTELKDKLETLARFGTCLGNRNFHRTSQTDSYAKKEYWRHAQCLLLYEKTLYRRERCCDNCFSLNRFLTRKQRELVIPSVDDDDEDDVDDGHKPVIKRIKPEALEIKEEPLD